MLALPPSFDPSVTADDPATAAALALVAFDPSLALDLVEGWERDCSPDDRPLLAAARARVLYALDRSDLATVALDRALELGHGDAVALATVAHPEGERFGHARLGVGAPGQRADAACDLAWRALCQDQLDDARQLLATARRLCPGHAEAGHWQRFLDLAGDRAGGLVRKEEPCPPEEPLLGDLAELCPSPWTGWWSSQRVIRRLLGARYSELPLDLGAPLWPGEAPAGSALARLRTMGCCSRIMATERDYTRLPADHALVAAEAALDLTLALEREPRPAHVAAAEAWRVARAIDQQATQDAANALVALGLRTPECLKLGLEAAAWLRRAEPGEDLWPAYQAALRIADGQVAKGLRQLRRLMGRDRLDSLGLVLGVESLVWRGEERQARALLDEALQQPKLGSTAVQLLRNPGGRPSPVVSGRRGDRLA